VRGVSVDSLIIEFDDGQHKAEAQCQYDRGSGLESRTRGPLTPNPSPARGEGSMTGWMPSLFCTIFH
jgi:hypothetical protein